MKSIRSKLTLSYLIIILISMAVTSFFFQSRMRQVLEDSLKKESFAQARVVADTISSLSLGPEDIIGPAENLTDRYSENKEKQLKVYSTGGYLIANSREPNIGYLDSGFKKINQLFPPTAAPGTPIIWNQSNSFEKSFYHKTWPVVSNDNTVGALDISIVEKPGLSEEKKETVYTNIDKIGTDILTAFNTLPPQAQTISELEIIINKNNMVGNLARARIYNSEGYLLANTQNLEADIVKSINSQERLSWFVPGSNERLLSVAIPVKSGLGKVQLGILVLSTSMQNIDVIYGELRQVLFFAIIVSLVVTTIISLFLAFGLIRPLTKIEDAANRISKGDFSVDISYEGSDEIKSVVDAINYMSSQIQTNINQISGEKDKINALLSALPDGVIALNSDGQIQFLNTTALEFIDVSGEEAVGKNLFDLRQDPELKEFFDEGKEKDSLYTREISFPPNILKLHLIPYGEKTEIEPGMMMVIQDVTDLRRLEETRTSFLGAISHELRTPLTIIKGYLYTIIDEKQVQENELMQTALEVIDRETDRQSRLVSDLLELSRLRSRKLSIEMETVKIEDLVEETVNQLRTNAERMGISLQLFSNVQNIEIFADKDRMKQVFINLIDNAIKYTPQDGKVVVRTRQAPDFWEVEVEDTGMGIAKDELPFLFERFFRTKDKKKKKYIKGTGLGMAIVKEIVDAHRGIIDVSSREGEGTKILVKIPLNLKETIESERKSTD